MDEIFDVVDEFDRVVARAPRSVVHRDRLLHRAAHIFAFDDRGRLWLQQRSASKDSSPLRWDSSAAGHLGAGESYDVCAIREVREELGLEVVPQFRFKLLASEQTAWEHVGVYRCQVTARICFQTDEILQVQSFPVSSIAAWIDRAPDQFARSFITVYRAFQYRGCL